MTPGMHNFEFRTVPHLHIEWEGAQKLGSLAVEKFPQRNALLVTDSGLVQAGLIAPISANLETSGFTVTLFDGVLPDPTEAILLDCVDLARRAGVDVVIGLGGGSSLDVAKLTAVLMQSKQALPEMYGIGNVRGARLPLILIPTTSGTGSEVTHIAILTTKENTKMGVVAPQLYADFVLLDASLTTGLPPRHTAATGIDAMVHAIEAYTSRHKKNPISDALAKEALRLLSSNLIQACREGLDRGAREGMLLGAMLAGQAFSNAPVAAVHALAYPLGGHYHIPHGLSNALMLGPVLRFNAPAAAALYAQLADVIGAPGNGTIFERATDFVAAMEHLMNESGAPRRLRDVGVKEEDLPMMAADAMKQTRLLVNNPVDVTESDAMALYREAF